jgi:flavorubredoxin
MMVFEETSQSLFPADLFIQPDAQPAIVRENLNQAMCQLYRETGIFAAPKPVLTVVDRIEQLAPSWVHPMHGGSLPGEMLPSYTQALRSELFAFDGRLFGRQIVG